MRNFKLFKYQTKKEVLLNLKKTFEKISKVYTHCTETYFSEVIRKREKKKESNEDENIRTEQKQRTIKINFSPKEFEG